MFWRPPIRACAWILLAVTTCALPPAFSREPGGAGRLVFLLEYVGTDYAGAVRDGRVVSESEYGEVLRFTRQVIEEYAALGHEEDAVLRGLRELQQSIVARAPAGAVWAKTREILPLLSRALGSSVRPAVAPDLENGRALWARDCASCHGASGAGDGRAAGGMEPRPAPFSGELLERLSPRQAYGAVSFGIEGTAMPSFAEAYSEEELWDVAFFVFTLRPGFAAARPSGAAPAQALDELVASSNAELLARLRSERPDASAQDVDFARVHFAAPEPAPDSALSVALRLQEAFSGVAARAFPAIVGVAGYVRDASWSTEKLHAERGEGWLAANPDALRYPGFRPAHTGSGFLVDREGYVLSSDRAVRDDQDQVASLVDVELEDGSHLEARVVGSEPTLDLAVLRIAEPKRLPESVRPLPLGDSARLQAGHWLIALADPPGPERTFAVGLVAAPPARACYQEDLSATLLQSSLVLPARGIGGPILDITGRVVGIGVERRNAAGALGILPINLALNLFEALKVAGSQRSPWIGISVLEIPLVRRRLGAQARTLVFPPSGVYVDDVFDPSPAASAGVRSGDFLLGLAGHKVLSVSDFQKWLYISGIGTTVELELEREGRPLQRSVPIEERPESATTR